MALKQTRRTVSLNRWIYDAAAAEAAKRGMSLSHFVDWCIREQGVKAPKSDHMAIEDVAAMNASKKLTPEERLRRDQQKLEAKRAEQDRKRREMRLAAARGAVAGLLPGEREEVLADLVLAARREGPIRQALGDEIADMCGEP